MGKGQMTENKPAAVPERAKQAGEITAQKARIEPAYWTERMLTTLNKGESKQMDKSDASIKAGQMHTLPSKGVFLVTPRQWSVNP